MRKRRPCRTKVLRLTALAGLAICVSIDPSEAFQNSGPGTHGGGIPQPFSVRDFESVRGNPFPFPSTLSPGLLHAFGGCLDPEGNPPNSPVEYDLALRTDEDTSESWAPGQMRELVLILRSSSFRWVRTPPRIDIYLVGGNGRDLLLGGAGADYDKGSAGLASSLVSKEGKAIADGSSNTLLFTVPEIPPGVYRFDLFERSTGLCKASDFSFQIGGGPEATPTPTPTETPDPTPTPTSTPLEPTPTRTLRMPDYDGSLFVDGIDLPGFLTRLFRRDVEADLDTMEGTDFRDLFMFSLWWQNDRLRE